MRKGLVTKQTLMTMRAKALPPPEETPDAFTKGQRVEVTNGLSAGLQGVVVGRAEIRFGGLPMYLVDLGGVLHVRTMRVDYLRLLV